MPFHFGKQRPFSGMFLAGEKALIAGELETVDDEVSVPSEEVLAVGRADMGVRAVKDGIAEIVVRLDRRASLPGRSRFPEGLPLRNGNGEV